MILLTVVALAWWGFSAFSSKLQRLGRSMVGGFNARSTSMEPYELSFKTHLKDGRKPKDREEPFEWKLVVPRAFVVNEIGSQSAISGSGDRGNEEYTAHIELTPDFEPTMLKADTQSIAESIAILFDNDEAEPLIRTELGCEQLDKYWKIVESRGGRKAPAQPTCTYPYKRCEIYTHYRGWDVTLSAPRESSLYREPQTACELVGRFLDKHTMSVDDLSK